MVENGLYPIAGIFVIFAHEMPRTSSTLPRKPLPDFLTKGVGCQTFQEEEIVAPFDEHNLPENVFLAGTHPHPFNPSAVRHWSQNACPPRAYSGMKVHGRVNLTLFFITPPRFQRLLEPCAKPEERFQWAKERYLYTVSGQFVLSMSLWLIVRCMVDVLPWPESGDQAYDREQRVLGSHGLAAHGL